MGLIPKFDEKSPTGRIINPLELPEEEANCLLGKPVMDALRKSAANWNPPEYVQLVRAHHRCDICQKESVDLLGTPLMFGYTSDKFGACTPSCGHGRFLVCPECWRDGGAVKCPVCSCGELLT